MNDAELLHHMRLFLAALPDERKRIMPSDVNPSIEHNGHAFAVATLRINIGNQMARKFRVSNTIAGPLSEDFTRGFSVAIATGLISWVSPAFRSFFVEITPRQCAELATDPLFASAKELAEEYLRIVYYGTEGANT